MSVDLFFNAASGRVVDGGTTAPAAGTVETWVIDRPALFVDDDGHTAATGVYCFRVVDVADRQLPPEIILVTNATPQGVWTVTRGVEGTVPVAHRFRFSVKAVHTSRSDTTIAAGALAAATAISDVDGGSPSGTYLASQYIGGGTP